jgi:hypothetical protein
MVGCSALELLDQRPADADSSVFGHHVHPLDLARPRLHGGEGAARHHGVASAGGDDGDGLARDRGQRPAVLLGFVAVSHGELGSVGPEQAQDVRIVRSGVGEGHCGHVLICSVARWVPMSTG